MPDLITIPMFPLAIFPLPGELVPLHIFEPRYRQLLEDAEEKDITFGIFYNHTDNTERLGSLMKLESVVKRYPGGESDIVVRCLDIFQMGKLYRNFGDKLYPGGDVEFWETELDKEVNPELRSEFESFRSLMNIKLSGAANVSVFHIANDLSFSFGERLRFVLLNDDKKESFLSSHLSYQKQLLLQAEKAKDVFHLN